MTYSLDAQAFQSRLQRLETLLQDVEHWTDQAAQAQLREIVQSVLDLHRTGLERMLQLVGATVVEACAADGMIAGMLLLHDLHPLELEARVRQALEEVRPALRSHGGDVELLEVREGIVRLRLQGNCHGCPSSAATMRQTVEEAILGKAPDAVKVEVEGLVDEATANGVESARLALPIL
ncbi:MAG TPA: NifU family protein [Gemmataceae bacterium]|nr:NifU family protein [Gemmataceae bacterium]